MRAALCLLAALPLAFPCFAVTTTLDPADYIVAPGGVLSGVSLLMIARAGGTVGCSGALIADGSWLLTAAHCLTGQTPNLDLQSLTATFAVAPGVTESLEGVSYRVHPGWTGDLDAGYDFAIVKLSGVSMATRYELYRGSTEQGRTVQLAGYGAPGTGAQGSQAFDGQKRTGENRIDGYWGTPENGWGLAYDFDDGTAAHDATSYVFGYSDLGLGVNEVLSSRGDSGGPIFLDGLLAGVVSFGSRLPQSDTTGAIDSSFGDLAGAGRVSVVANWVDAVTVPEVSTLALCGGGLLLVGLVRRRR